MKKSQIQDNFICKFYTNFQERNNILHLQKTKQTLLNSLYSIQFSSVQFSHSVMSDSVTPWVAARLSYPSLIALKSQFKSSLREKGAGSFFCWLFLSIPETPHRIRRDTCRRDP